MVWEKIKNTWIILEFGMKLESSKNKATAQYSKTCFMWPLMHHKSESRMKPHRKPTNRYYYAVNSQVCSNPHITFNV